MDVGAIKIVEKDFVSLPEQVVNDWKSVLDRSSSTCLFQTPEWIGIILNWIDNRGRIVLAYHNDEAVGAYFYYQKKGKYIFKKSSTGIFESPYGGPIVVDGIDKELVINKMVAKVESNFLLSGITLITPPFNDIQFLSQKGFQIKQKSTMILKLDKSLEELMSQMSSMKRRNIRKAEKNNVRIEDVDKEGIQEFHAMLTSTYERLELSPPIHIDFYKALFDQFHASNNIKLSIAYLEDKPIAAAIFLLFGDHVIFWQGASYREYMKLGANDLIHWKIIEYARQTGYSYYNLLHFHDDRGNELESLKKFKQGFGGRPEHYIQAHKKRKPL